MIKINKMITMVLAVLISTNMTLLAVEKKLTGVQQENLMTIEKGTKCFVEGEYFVPKGKTLRVQEGVEIIFDMNASLLVSGVIEVVGIGNKPVIFRGKSDRSSYWKGIKIEESNASYIEHASISNAKTGIEVYGCNASISDCLISKNDIGVTTNARAVPVIFNCLIVKNRKDGLLLLDSSSPEIINCTVSENRGWGILGSYDNSPNVSKSIITNNKKGGVFCTGHISRAKANYSIIHSNSKYDIRKSGPESWDFTKNYWGKKLTKKLIAKGPTAGARTIKGERIRLHDFLTIPPKKCGYQAVEK